MLGNEENLVPIESCETIGRRDDESHSYYNK